VTSALPESSARERLDAVAGTVDGFELSRIDLEQRREGDVLGASQSGSRSHLRLLRVLRDESMIEQAREDASTILEGDIKQYSLLEAELSQIQSDAAAEYIDKS
jgi:ATP-dependent DNA helicase RecG